MGIDSVTGSASSQIAGAIRSAARSTGTSFEYLLTTARIESNLNPSAQASTSSATGLYQFIEQTWLGTMKQAGPSLGYGSYADSIVYSPDGRYHVPDQRLYSEIMRLRNDPAVSATMAGAFTRNNAAQLTAAIGRQPSEGELYLAHFLGHDGAARLIGAALAQPNASAAEMFPRAAAANRTIFYDPTGRARSAAEVYGRVTGRYEIARSLSFEPDPFTFAVDSGALAQSDDLPPPVPPKPIPNVTPVQEGPPLRAPDPAGTTEALALANVDQPPPSPSAEMRPFFRAMFTDRAGQPVSSTVTSLWNQSKEQPGAAPPVLDLFTDPKPAPRRLTRGGV